MLISTKIMILAYFRENKVLETIEEAQSLHN